MIELLAMILGAALLAFGASQIDATPHEKYVTYPWEVKQEVAVPNYKLVCRTPEGQIVLTAENLTLEEAEVHAAMFNENNHTMGSKNVWTVEPMRYH